MEHDLNISNGLFYTFRTDVGILSSVMLTSYAPSQGCKKCTIDKISITLDEKLKNSIKDSILIKQLPV